MFTLKEFCDDLWSNKIRKIYLSHYEGVNIARLFGRLLEDQGFKVTVAEDARRFGKEFVSEKIAECDITMVLNPESTEENMILRFGGTIIDIRI